VKQCYKCKETKPVSEFPVYKKNKDGLFSYCKECKRKLNATNHTKPKGRAYKLLADARYNKKGKRANLEKTLVLQDILPILEIGKCELTGLPFDFIPSKNSFRNLYSPSLDRIDSSKGYTKDNVRIVLSSVNCALGEYTDEEMLPILEAMVKGIKKNVNKRPTTPVSNGDYIQGAVGAELGSISTPWTWEDGNNSDHHCGADARQDADHSPEESGGDSVGRGGQEVGTSKTLEGFKNYWESRKTISWP